MASKNTPPVRTGKLTIRQLEMVVGNTRLSHALHRHDYYFILAVEKGSGIHRIDFIDYEVRNRSVFVVRPGQVHQLELEAGSTGYLIEFDNAFYQPANTITGQRFKKAISKNFCEIPGAIFHQLLGSLKLAFSEYDARQDGYAEAISAYLDLFFITWKRQCAICETSEPGSTDYSRERYEEFMQELEAKIHQEKSPAAYAKHLSLSLYQLNSITKAVANKTVSELINEQIVLEAKRHLLGTTGQVKDIAFNLGYEDVSYFVRFFKKNTGHTPDVFRKNFK
jgi:AraC-like DNA-binding protein/mannose-6-phosphate isomerase-like protein (cupin superfamily)